MKEQSTGFESGRREGEALLDEQTRRYWDDSTQALAAVLECSVPALEQRVLAFYRERLDAVPDLTTYPELRGYRDRLMEKQRGMLSAGVSEERIAISESLDFWRSTRLLQETGRAYYAEALTEKCRVLYLADSDRGPLLLKNVDDPLEYWRPAPPPPQGSPWPLSEPLIFDGVGSGLHIDEIPPEIFPVEVRGLCLEHCSTVDEARDFMVRYNYFWSGQNLIICDYRGQSLAFDKTACRVAVHEPNAQGVNYINGMTARDPEISAFQKECRRKWLEQSGQDEEDSVEGRYFIECENTLRNMTGYVAELSAKPTWENAKQLMEQRDRSGPMCLTGHKCHPEQTTVACTLQMRIFELAGKRQHRRQWHGDVPAYLDTPEIIQFV